MGSIAQCVSAVIESSRGGCAPATRRGLTLVELLVVISIIAVLSGILVPVIGAARNSAKRAQTAVLISTVSTATSQFRQEHRRLPGVFTQEELASPTNLTGFTQMENAILDLAGGVDPLASIGAEGVFELTLSGRSVRVNSRMIASADGPGYLPLTLKGMRSREREANGLAPARADVDQMIDLSRGTAGDLDMPDILDAWGRPIMMWARNEYAGDNAAFARIDSETDDSQRKARFYWASNRGYLDARSQRSASSLGAAVAPAKRRRSLDALLGDPAIPDPFSGGQGEIFVPMAPKGDVVFHGAGRDGVYMDNGGEERMEYRYSPGGSRISANTGEEIDRFWRYVEGLDDLVAGAN